MSPRWNVIITALPGRVHEQHLLEAAKKLGKFHPSSFKDVCVGQVSDIDAFLDRVKHAVDAGEPWASDLGRVIPIERTFHFTTETLVDQLNEAVAPMLERLLGGTFYVRMERRGHAGEISSSEVERAVADFLIQQAVRQGHRLTVSFENPDYILCAETLGDECGVGLLSRHMRLCYPFVDVR